MALEMKEWAWRITCGVYALSTVSRLLVLGPLHFPQFSQFVLDDGDNVWPEVPVLVEVDFDVDFDICQQASLVTSLLNSILLTFHIQVHLCKKRCVYRNTQIKVCISYFWRCPGTWHTRQSPCFSVVPEATYKASRGPLEGHIVSSKSPSRVHDRDKGVAGRNGREKYFPE